MALPAPLDVGRWLATTIARCAWNQCMESVHCNNETMIQRWSRHKQVGALWDGQSKHCRFRDIHIWQMGETLEAWLVECQERKHVSPSWPWASKGRGIRIGKGWKARMQIQQLHWDTGEAEMREQWGSRCVKWQSCTILSTTLRKCYKHKWHMNRCNHPAGKNGRRTGRGSGELTARTMYCGSLVWQLRPWRFWPEQEQVSENQEQRVKAACTY